MAQLTGLLRNDPSEFWSRFRALLQGRGIDPADAALAESVQEGDDLEFAVVVTGDHAVFEVEWSPTEGVIEWDRTTDRWRDSPHRSGIEEAFALLVG